MARKLRPQSKYETTLSSAITSSASTMSVATAPTETTGILVIEPGTSNEEFVYYSSVSGTTITIGARGLDKSSVTATAISLSAVSANQKSHPAGATVAMKDAHHYIGMVTDVINGDSATGMNLLKLGDDTSTLSAGTRYLYFQTSGGGYGFVGLSANGRMVVSEDGGSSSYVISAGGSGVAAGSGIDITAGVASLKSSSAGALSATSGGAYIRTGAGIGITSNDLVVSSSQDFTWSGTNSFTGTLKLGTTQVSSTAAELNKLAGTGSGVTAANLSTLTDSSSTTALHFHNYSCGVSARAINSTGTQVFAHSLGVQPRLIKIFCAATGTNSYGFSSGAATTSASQSCTFMQGANSNLINGVSQNAAAIVDIYAYNGSTSTDIAIASVSALDSSNITLNWSTNANIGGSRQYSWEAWA